MLFQLVFDAKILKQLERASRNQTHKQIFTTMFDKLERSGPHAGKLLSSQHAIYEMKNKRPPLRVYFQYRRETTEIYVLEFEMKTNERTQQKNIERIKERFKNRGPSS